MVEDNQYCCGLCHLELSDDKKSWVRPCSRCVIAEINEHVRNFMEVLLGDK